MALPPERISLKRRRDDPQVDIVVFDSTRSSKRRHTEYAFKLLNPPRVPQLPRKPSQEPRVQQPPVLGNNVDKDGIPTVRATEPGDEIKDFERLKAAKQGQSTMKDRSSTDAISSTQGVPEHRIRRFHLAADLKNTTFRISSDHLSSQRFRNLRPPVPTFIEKRLNDHTSELNSKSINETMAEDHPNKEQPASSGVGKSQPSRPRDIGEHKIQSGTTPVGHSMYDDPRTWDTESDQLADELAAFALELEPPTRFAASSSNNQVIPEIENDVKMELETDYVYETYIRVAQADLDYDPMIVDGDAQVGVLVIDDSVEDLWLEYLREDDTDDDEWDEEDSNAEDNPANDYPEDEVESDDEFGRNAYQYRRDRSDEESSSDDD